MLLEVQKSDLCVLPCQFSSKGWRFKGSVPCTKKSLPRRQKAHLD